MFWESSGVVGFDLGPLLEGQMRTAKLKSAYYSLIIGARGFGALSLRWIHFIALIHPIQWTIAYPVGADRPAKRQKKTSCVSTGQVGPVLCTRQVACSTSFLSRQRDVIASFSFGACPVYTKI